MDGWVILIKRFMKLKYRAVGEGLAPPSCYNKIENRQSREALPVFAVFGSLFHDFIRKDLALIVVEHNAFGAVLVQRDAAADEGVAFFATKDGL